MKEYENVFAPTAREDLVGILEWLEQESPEKVAEWYQAIKSDIQTLTQMPERCPHAPENGLWGDEELRQLLFQRYPSQYRIIFYVSKSAVHILSIRHGARSYLHEE